MTTYPSGLDALVQREATQLRLNDELDAGTHAVFSDVESYLRPRAVRPGSTNANDPRATDATAVGTAKGGVSRKGTASLRGPITSAAGASVSRAAQIISTSTHGGAQTAPEAKALLAGREDAAARSVGGRGAGRGGGEVALEGGGVWGGDLWFDRVEARGETGGRGLGARVGAGGVGGGTATSSPLFKVSERLRGAARASGERTRRKAAGVSQSPPSGNDESKAKLAACQAQLEEVMLAHQAGRQEAVELRRQLSSEQEHTRRVSRQLQQSQLTAAKEAKAKEEEAAKAAALSARVSDLERDLTTSNRTARQNETDKKSLEVRLHRALEEVSKQKEALRQAQGQTKDRGQGQRLEVARLEAHCQRLERQKLELLTAFKKQLKLIDVLKRQKLHAEATRALGFTEEDFVKTLDWDSR
eukprot:jgi/Undpi1/7077/HiC_scaffold_22.g09551.m1